MKITDRYINKTRHRNDTYGGSINYAVIKQSMPSNQVSLYANPLHISTHIH